MVGYVFICCIVAVLPAFLCTHWLCVEYTKYPEGIKDTSRKKAAIEQAVAEGRMAIATLVKCWPKDNDPPHDQRVKYEYSYQGKTYTFTYDYIPADASDNPPKEVTVYFRKSPKHAKMYSDFGHMESEKKYVFLSFWICFSLLLFVLLMHKVREAGLI